MRLCTIMVLASALLLAGSIPASAQETTGTVQGRVVDTQGLAVPGASVTASGPQGTKTTVTADEGRFSIPFLLPGSYTVRVELQGFKAAEQKDVLVGLGQSVDLSLKLEVGVVNEVVQVQASTPSIDATTSTIGSVLNTDELRQIPVGRTLAQTLYLTPGVSSSGSLGTQNPSISGGSGLENQYVIDGTNVTNTGYGGLGSYSITFGSLGNATPYDFIQEIQVKTGGYGAEYGQATGGVVNVVTKSGTNNLKGSAFAYSQPTGLEGDWKQYQAINGSVNTVSTRAADAGVEGGGPIIKNKLFFFGAIDPSFQRKALIAPDGFPLTGLGEVERKRHTTSYSAKGTAQIGGAHRLDASFFGDPSHGDNGPQRSSALLRTTTSGFSELDYGGHQQTVRYDGIVTAHWLVEASFARSENKISELPSNNTWQVTDTTVVPNIVSGGIGQYEAGNVSLSRQYAVKSTNILGAHSVKYGIQFDDVKYQQLNQYTGPTFLAADGRQTATGASIQVIPDVNLGRIYRVTRANFNVSRDIPQTYFNFFAQDNWAVTDRLTVNGGIRYEQEKMSGTVIKDWQLKNNWAPRVGATYDATGDGRTKIYGNFGVFFARIPVDLAARALSKDDGFTRGDYYDANLTQVIPQGTPTVTPAQATTGASTTNHFILAGTSVDTIDPNAKLSYTKEVVLGIDRELAPQTTIGIRYVFRNMPRVLEDVANCPMVAYELAQTSDVCSSVEYILTNPSQDTQVNPEAVAIVPAFGAVKFDDPVHKYNAIEATFTRRGAKWTAMTSYRWSRLRGNFEGFYRDDNGQSDPGISSLYDFPTNDPTYTSIGTAQLGYPGDIRFLGDANGILPLDRPHQIKVSGNYMFIDALNVGVNINLSSGKPLTAMAANPNYTSRGEIPEEARGAGIDTIDGFMTRTPFQSQVDLQASYNLRMGGGRRRLTLLGEVFNLFNEKRVLVYDQNTQLTYPNTNLDFGAPVDTNFSGTPPQFQAPISVRVGVRFEF
jgi:outer membrane receptor protein involved in Fe transport